MRKIIKEEVEQAATEPKGGSEEATVMEKEGRAAAALAQQQLKRIPQKVREVILTAAKKSPQTQRAVMAVVLQSLVGLSTEQINALYKQGAKAAIQ